MTNASFTIESTLAQKAVALSIQASHARGIPVYYGKGGWLIQEMPNGEKKKIKKIKRNALYER